VVAATESFGNINGGFRLLV